MSKTRSISQLIGEDTFTLSGTPANIGVGSANPTSKLNVSGIVSATSFYGDGSNLTGISVATDYASTAGIATYSSTAGIATVSEGLIGTPDIVVGVITATNVVVGGATTQLLVNGDARVTGILSIGTSSITLDASDNTIKLSNDAIIRRDNSTGDIRFLDDSGNLKKIIANEVRVGTGDSTAVIKTIEGKVVFEDSNGQEVSIAKSWVTISSGIITTLSVNTQYLANTSSGVITAYLPQSPQIGEYVVIVDSTGTFGINTCFIVQNASATGPSTYIQGSLEYLEADVQHAIATLTYTGISTTGWLVK